jgi:hypothetical protein
MSDRGQRCWTPALDAWRRRWRERPETRTRRDRLWRAACWECAARERLDPAAQESAREQARSALLDGGTR